MYSVVVFVPESHANSVKEAVFGAKAGRVGNYDRCCWQVAGQGQFRPLAGSTPFLGQQNAEQHVEELRIEFVCDDQHIKSVIVALKQAHPYEEPPYHVVKVLDI